MVPNVCSIHCSVCRPAATSWSRRLHPVDADVDHPGHHYPPERAAGHPVVRSIHVPTGPAGVKAINPARRAVQPGRGLWGLSPEKQHPVLPAGCSLRPVAGAPSSSRLCPRHSAVWRRSWCVGSTRQVCRPCCLSQSYAQYLLDELANLVGSRCPLATQVHHRAPLQDAAAIDDPAPDRSLRCRQPEFGECLVHQL